MGTLTQVSYGGTAANVTGTGLIVELDSATRCTVMLLDGQGALHWNAMRLMSRVLALLVCVTSSGLGVAVEPQSAPPAPPRAATRSLALEELHAREPDPARIAHALAVEAIMGALARRLRGEAEEWGLAGLLHDIDLAEKGITNRIDSGLEEACAALGLTVNELLSVSLSAMRASSMAATLRPSG
jgi:hypothetical protein